VNGQLTGYYLDGDQMLLEKQGGGGANLAVYTWGNGLIRCNGEYPLTDGRGNVRLTTDGSRNVTSSNAPDAYGVASYTANTASAYLWNGGAGYRTENLAPLGLPLNYSFQKVGDRYYDPTLACFLTRDTELGEKPYAYCGGDPVNFSDPSGHDSRGDVIAGLGAILALVAGIGLGIGAVSLIPLPLLLLGGAIYIGIVAFTGVSLTDYIIEGKSHGKSGAGEGAGNVHEPPNPNPKGIGSISLNQTYELWMQGSNDDWYYKGTTTDTSLPLGLPPGARTHRY